jgi:hypothetical protein
MHEAYQPVVDDGRGISPEDFRVKAPLGFNDAEWSSAPDENKTDLLEAMIRKSRCWASHGADPLP